jgi:hypothetical protein
MLVSTGSTLSHLGYLSVTATIKSHPRRTMPWMALSLKGMRSMKFTIGVTPDKSNSFAREIELTKVALIYADSISLCSPFASMVYPFLTATEEDYVSLLKYISCMSSVVGEGVARDAVKLFYEFNQLSRKRHRSGAEIIVTKKFEKLLRARNNLTYTGLTKSITNYIINSG